MASSSLVTTMASKLRLLQQQQQSLKNAVSQQQQQQQDFSSSSLAMDRCRDFLKRCGRTAVAAVTIVLVASTNSLAALPPGPPRFSYTEEQAKEFMKTRRTYDAMRVRSYLMVDAPGEGSKCPSMEPSSKDTTKDGFSMGAGSFTVVNMCLEPATYTVRRFSRDPERSYLTKDTTFLTSYTSSFQGIVGSLDVGDDGKLKLEGSSTDDEATITLRLPSGDEYVKFAYALKGLVATGETDSFSGKFSTLPLKDQYEDKNAGRLSALSVVDISSSSSSSSNSSSSSIAEVPPSGGDIVFRVTKSNPETGEVTGEFESNQLSPKEWVRTPYSGFPIRSTGHKNIKTEGIWYARLERSQPSLNLISREDQT